MTQVKDFRLPALELVRQVQSALPALRVDFAQADATLEGVGQWLQQAWLDEAMVFLKTHRLAVISLITEKERARVRGVLAQVIPPIQTPSLATLEPQRLQLFHLLLLLLTRGLHLGDVLLYTLDGDRESHRLAPRPELGPGTGWQALVSHQHRLVRHTLRFMIAHRDSRYFARVVKDHRLPFYLGWVDSGGETLLEDLLSARTPLYLHQLFEILFLLEISVDTFVRFLYFHEAGTVGTSRRQLRALLANDAPGNPGGDAP